MKYWYFIYTKECVLCGKTDTYRERRYTPKPETPELRYKYEQDACSRHFM